MPAQKRKQVVIKATRVGIDFGDTIGRIENESAFPFALEMIQHLVSKFGAENVFIISKAGLHMQVRILQWLEDTQFYKQTNMNRANVVFVREYVDKVQAVEELQISVFFDDHFKVVSSLSKLAQIKRIFWMHADTRQLKQIDRQDRNKISITHSWSNTMKYFQKIPPTIEYTR